jgi:multidrug transporter EmrE-like cation transporter
MKFWLFMVATLLLDWIGVSMAKQYIVSNNWLWLAGGILCFSGLIITMIQLFRLENLAVANALWAGLAVVGMTIISWTLFGEKLSPVQIIGMVLVVGGIILLELPR